MSTEQTKAEFEKWWQDEEYDDQLKNYQGLLFNRIKANMLKAFAASRAALVVELPEKFEVEMGAYGTAEVISVTEAKAALRAAGITVKDE